MGLGVVSQPIRPLSKGIREWKKRVESPQVYPAKGQRAPQPPQHPPTYPSTNTRQILPTKLQPTHEIQLLSGLVDLMRGRVVRAVLRREQIIVRPGAVGVIADVARGVVREAPADGRQRGEVELVGAGLGDGAAVAEEGAEGVVGDGADAGALGDAGLAVVAVGVVVL